MPAVQTGQRRSGRIALNKPVQVSGVNVEGRDFAAPGNTRLLSRHGAMIVVRQGLAPDQEVGVYNPETARDEAARVVAMWGKESEGFVYGVEFLDPEIDFWNITFPAAGPAPAAGSDRGSSAAGLSAAPATQKTGASGADIASDANTRKDLPGPAQPTSVVIAEIRPLQSVSPVKNGPSDFSILLKCPHDGQDQWMILRQRSEPLHEILSTRWPFECPLHGVQQEFPVIASEGAVASENGAAGGDPAGEKAAYRFGELEAFNAPSSRGSSPRVRTRYAEEKRVWVRGIDALGNPFSQTAYSINISRNGARLYGLGFLAGPGVKLELRRNWKKALYQVVWMGQHGSQLANQTGLICLEPEKNVWGLS